MYAPASLLSIAAASEKRYTALLAQFPPGTIHHERNEAHREMEMALACAAWMEANNLTELENVGPFGVAKVERGAMMRIRKGSRIFSTAPGVGREGVEAKRAQVIKVHSYDPGYVNLLGGNDNGDVRQGTIRWAGAGGYWRWTDINNVELLPGAASAPSAAARRQRFCP